MRGFLNDELLAGEVDGRDHPVHKIQVNVIQLQKLQLSPQRGFGVFFVLVVPQLRGDEKVLSLNTGLEALLQSFSDEMLVSVHLCSVDVAVPMLENAGLDHLLDVSFIHAKGPEA